MSDHSSASKIPNDIPPPPEPPEGYECCDNGCDELCVFEIYKLQKADYDAKWGHVIDKNE
ncbi:hypothetical protein IM753_10460 [Moraxella sp. K127]|uniref:oxidoreductase-like domain-containing protein n=1 Tax=Moraxella TaxID=475 RepID=UPI0018823922|nr:oxidoreductase-like domain-containing protein [Moraxella sp. K127]MBE9591380.1 hypothetical protein [Moraxella sp. K127]